MITARTSSGYLLQEPRRRTYRLWPSGPVTSHRATPPERPHTQAVHDFNPLMDMFNPSWTVRQNPWVKPDANRTAMMNSKPVNAELCDIITCAMIAAPPGQPALRCAAEKSLAYTERALREGTQHTFCAGESPGERADSLDPMRA